MIYFRGSGARAARCKLFLHNPSVLQGASHAGSRDITLGWSEDQRCEANHIAASRIAASRDSCGTIRATIVEIASLLQPCLSKSKSPSPK